MRSVARTANGSCRGLQPPFEKGLLYPDSCCALPQRLSFFAAGPAAIRRRRGVHTSGGVATVPPAATKAKSQIAPKGAYARPLAAAAVTVRCGRAPAENRPGSRGAASVPGERQPLKLTRYRSHVGGLRPRRGGPYHCVCPGAQPGCIDTVNLVTVPAPGRLSHGGARCQGPTMLPSPHQAA